MRSEADTENGLAALSRLRQVAHLGAKRGVRVVGGHGAAEGDDEVGGVQAGGVESREVGGALEEWDGGYVVVKLAQDGGEVRAERLISVVLYDCGAVHFALLSNALSCSATLLSARLTRVHVA